MGGRRCADVVKDERVDVAELCPDGQLEVVVGGGWWDLLAAALIRVVGGWSVAEIEYAKLPGIAGVVGVLCGGGDGEAVLNCGSRDGFDVGAGGQERWQPWAAGDDGDEGDAVGFVADGFVDDSWQ